MNNEEKAKERILFNNYFKQEEFDDVKKLQIERYLEDNPDSKDYEPSDEDIFEEIAFSGESLYEDFAREMERFIDGNTFILKGFTSRWNGRYNSGFIFKTFNELAKAWNDCDYVNVYDKNGHLYVECSHHDGTNCYEIRMLNKKGRKYYDNHYLDDDRELHKKLMEPSHSVLPNYAHTMWDCPEKEYERSIEKYINNLE